MGNRGVASVGCECEDCDHHCFQRSYTLVWVYNGQSKFSFKSITFLQKRKERDGKRSKNDVKNPRVPIFVLEYIVICTLNQWQNDIQYWIRI